jgi:ZIP family zinc transporter
MSHNVTAAETTGIVDVPIPEHANPQAVRQQSPGKLAMWAIALLPLALLAVLVVWLIRSGPADFIQGDAPPVEKLAITRADLRPGSIDLTVLNDGPDPVTIAQVIVDDAFWAFEASAGTTLGHLQSTRLSIPYPWVQGEAHLIRLLTSTGLTFEHAVPVAIETPTPSARYLGVFALIGLYVGVIPVAIGLLWYPLMSGIGKSGLQFLLALTVGLLAYLFVDATHDGLEAAALVPGSYQGTVLFIFGAVAAYVTLDAIGAWIARRRKARADALAGGWALAVMIAVGIGLHNFGEGLAIGSAFALGELALGTLLIVGFTLHNTTEGLAIIAPLARRNERIGLYRLIQLGLIGGVPTIAGAWIGAFIYSPLLAVLFLSLGVGAIAQVTRQIVMQGAGAQGLTAYLRERAVVSGLAAGVAIMYVTGLIVG